MLPSPSRQNKIFLYPESDGQKWVIQVIQEGTLDRRMEAASREQALRDLVIFLLGESQVGFYEPDDSDEFCLLRGDKLPTGPDAFYIGEDRIGGARLGQEREIKPLSIEEALEVKENNSEYNFKVFKYPYKKDA